MKKQHVAVVMGGLSKEREVSQLSGKGIIAALESRGYKVTPIDMGRDIATVLEKVKPDVVFNALHGTYGEDGCLPGLLNIMDIPYTHSGVLASAIAMDKPMAKHLFNSVGICCPGGKVVSREEMFAVYALGEDILPRPFVVKPTAQGSSVGVHIIREIDNEGFTEKEWDFGEKVLVEPFIPGHELSVAVLDGKALGVIELCTSENFYDYTAKYTDGKTQHIMPAKIDKKFYDEAMYMAERAHNVLGARGVTRADIRFDDTTGEGKLYLLEVNTHPGMTPLSLVPEIAAYRGIDFATLIERLVEGAACDYQEKAQANTHTKSAVKA